MRFPSLARASCALPVFLFLGLFSAAQAHAECTPERPADCRSLNDSLNRITEKATVGAGANYFGRLPSEVTAGFEVLSRFKIPIYQRTNDLLKISDILSAAEVAFQEWIRATPNGMRWLPMNWLFEKHDIESEVAPIFIKLEATVNSILKSSGKSASDLLIASLYAGSIPHNGDPNYIQQLRKDAVVLGGEHTEGGMDRSFYDIRYTIHNHLTPGIITRVQEYIAKNRDNANGRFAAERILKPLLQIFGGSALDDYLEQAGLPSEDKLSLLRASILQKKLTLAKASKDVKKLIEDREVELTLMGLAATANAIRARILDARSAALCDIDMVVNCTIERFDELEQVQRVAFAIIGQLQERLVSLKQPVSLQFALGATEQMIRINASLGLLSSELAARFQKLSNDSSGSPQAVRDAIGALEREVGATTSNIRGALAPIVAKYRGFTPLADDFMANVLHSSALMPLTSWAASVKQLLRPFAGGDRLYFEDRLVDDNFQMLNPGVARGKLVIPSERELADENYAWSAKSIYLLSKTPSALRPVAGVLTADSGGLLSHIQLLIANAGIPNVYVGRDIVARLRQYEGKEIFVASIPGGEIQIKLASNMTSAEKSTYERLTKTRQIKPISLAIPSGISEGNQPRALRELRYTDRGRVAGGKACGQGELDRVFPGVVPAAIVLPFGVYYDHVKRSGIYDQIRTSLSDPKLARLQGDERVKTLTKKLADIREKIEAMPISDTVTRYIETTLGSREFLDEDSRPRGVFVRSDTNAEDLPEFSGAGLNLTIPNVRGIKEVVNAVKKVWASPFSDRSYQWRESLITNAWDALPSVVIQIAKPSQKAGVMVVGNTRTQGGADDEILINANFGLGVTVVDGNYTPEEILISRKQGTTVRMRNAQALTKVVLTPNGSVADVALSAAEMKGPVLLPAEIADLAEKGKTIQSHLAATYGLKDGKWDLEFGVIDGKTVLFQLRPFVGNKYIRDLGALEALAKNPVSPGAKGPSSISFERAEFLFEFSNGN